MSLSKDPFQINEIFQRYLDDNYSKEDLEFIIDYIQSEHEESFIRVFKKYWYHHSDIPVRNENELDLDSILDKIHHKLNLQNKRPLPKNNTSIVRNIISTSINVFYRIAAIMLIAIIIYGSYNYFKNGKLDTINSENYVDISTTSGSTVKVNLPDGSVAWLNNKSTLRYPRKFGNKYRELSLSGEAYFNVKSDKKHPFILNVPGIRAQVTGTKFNMMAYPDDPDIEVTLVEGKLNLFSNSPHNTLDQVVSLTPGDHVVIDHNSKRISKTTVEHTDLYTSWKDGILIFKNDPLAVIVKKLERRYNINIEFSDKKLSEYRFTATFTNETLPEVLNLLTVAAPMHYSIIPVSNQNNNVFTKRKIILSLKHKK